MGVPSLAIPRGAFITRKIGGDKERKGLKGKNSRGPRINLFKRLTYLGSSWKVALCFFFDCSSRGCLQPNLLPSLEKNGFLEQNWFTQRHLYVHMH